MYRIGYGSDTHKLKKGGPLMLGGLEIEYERSSVGHSDGDALLHAITDAVLGALALGDIGTHFPDSDKEWKDAESVRFLKEACKMARQEGYLPLNIDSTISLESPKLAAHIEEMREFVAKAMEVDLRDVSIKAKTAEGLGPIGKNKAIKAVAVVLLKEAYR